MKLVRAPAGPERTATTVVRKWCRQKLMPVHRRVVRALARALVSSCVAALRLANITLLPKEPTRTIHDAAYDPVPRKRRTAAASAAGRLRHQQGGVQAPLAFNTNQGKSLAFPLSTQLREWTKRKRVLINLSVLVVLVLLGIFDENKVLHSEISTPSGNGIKV